MDDETPGARAAYFRRVAKELRTIAEGLRLDPRRQAQLVALAAGFERFARRFERETTENPRHR